MEVARFSYRTSLILEGGGGCTKNLASYPGLRCFGLHKEHRGPGIFSHVCDVKGRKVVDLIERGHTGAQNSKKR